MNFKQYQEEASKFAIYKDTVIYPSLGLASEAGEVCDKIKKIMRDKTSNDFEISKQDADKIAAELGDVLWYVSALATDLGLKLEDIAKQNISKLQDRKDRDKLKGSGDNR
jgi:NTP pyrophosphatase (non-canonical NTP hydrolase)